jgi:translocation and assembly module TamB
MNDSPAPPPLPRPRRSRLWWLALLPVLLLLFTLGSWQWLLHSTGAVGRALEVANRYLPAPLAARGVSGTLADGLRVDALEIPAGTTRVIIESLELGIADWSIFSRSLDLSILSAARVRIVLPPPEKSPPSTPANLALPLNLAVARLHIGTLSVEREAPLLRVDDIDGELAYGRAGIAVRALAARLGENRLTLAGELAGRRPFAIDLGGTVQSRLNIAGQAESTPVQVVWRALNNLVDLQINAGVTGGPDQRARGAVRVQLASFAAEPLRSLSIDVEGFDPRAWFAGTPSANLSIRADLRPLTTDQLTLSGPVQATNAAAGPWDRRAIPVRSLAGSLTASATRVELRELQLELTRGTARGTFAIDPRAPTRWTLAAQLVAVDPSALHTQAQPWRIDGKLDVQQRGQTTQMQADLHGVDPKGRWPAALEAAVALDAARLNVERGILRVGSGVLELRGEMLFDATQRFSFSGSVRDFDPGRLVQGVDGRLNAELGVEGNVKPTLQGEVRAQIGESVLIGRPLRGTVRAGWRGDTLHDVDADLAVRGAQLTARGALGGANSTGSETLLIELRAPALGDLGLPLRGAATARATLRGAWQAPAISAQFGAKDLVAAGQRVAEATGRLDYAGGTDGTLAIVLDVREHRHPTRAELSLQQAHATVEGTLRRHRLAFEGQLAERATLRLAAQADLDVNAPLWRARIEQFEAGGVFDTRLEGTSPLDLGAGSVALGPARLVVHGARVDLDRNQWRDGRLETAGRVSNWRYGAAGKTGEPPLELRGEWSLRAADTLDGRVLIERVSGDLYGGGATQRTVMGLTELRLLGTARGRQLELALAARGAQAGRLQGLLRAEAERSGDGWRVAQDRPLSGNVEADFPTLEWVDRLLSANLRENIRVAGAARGNLRVSGTPRQPRVDGPIEADKLRVAWVEQGLRLENGRVRARLASDGAGNNELRIDEASFSGAPRVRPPDRRIAAVIAQDHQGSLEATGMVKLPSLEGVVQVRMEKFPLLQRSDRWLVATGGANLVYTPERAQLNGAAVVDAGFIDVSRRDAPTLSDDVVVHRRSDAPREATAERKQFAFDFDVTAELGSAFVLRGSGLDSRIAGALRVRHEGKGIVRATGTLNTRDGTYQGYGQNLTIRRGRVLFNGPIDNPGLDILALRSGLPVEVGISVTRTAQNPLVRLYSDPAMPDFETLSWLVLGRQPEEGRGDNAALASAALGLLGGGGEGMSTTLARRLGIDEFTIRSGTGASTTSLLPRQAVAGRLRTDGTNTLTSDIVTIGKRLSDDLTLSYEQVVGGSGGIAQLAYRLSRRFSVVARAGTDNALELVYAFSFD